MVKMVQFGIRSYAKVVKSIYDTLDDFGSKCRLEKRTGLLGTELRDFPCRQRRIGENQITPNQTKSLKIVRCLELMQP